MGKAVLVDSQIIEGKLFLEALDKANLQICAAFWIYYGMEPSWKLIISSEHPKLNPKKNLVEAYSVAIEVLRSIPSYSSIEGRIEIVDINHELIKKLAAVFQTDKEIAAIRVSDSMIEDIFFEDLYIYRMMMTSKQKNRKENSLKKKK